MEPRRWHAHYDEGIPVDFPFVERTLPEALDRSATDHGERTAIWFLNRRLTYRELGDRVDRMATALARLGVGKGARVAIQLPNLPQTIIATYGAWRLGARVVMTNPLYRPREIEHQWKDAGCTVAVVPDFLWVHRLRSIRDALPVREWIVASIPEYLAFPLSAIAPWMLRRRQPPSVATVRPEPHVHRFRELVERTPPEPPPFDVAPDDVAALQFTGGTTGVAKGALLSHRNLSVNVQAVEAWLHVTADSREVVLAALPFFHVFGLTIAMDFPVWTASAMVVMPDPRDIGALVDAVVRRRVTLFMGVPAMYAAIAARPGIERVDLSSISACFSGSAPLPVEVLRRFESLTGARIVEGFGLTETSPVTHVNPLRTQRKVGSIGVPFVATDARIVDLESGTRDLPPGEDGELLVRGPQVMRGYWNQPAETALVLRDGWLSTGDIAHMDEDGYFFISGRKKDMILVSGYNVYPDEVDGVLVAHPAVLEAATIGLPDARCGERVKSFVVRRPGSSATAEELVAYCRTQLAAYKVPREIVFRDALPKSPVLKVLRRELREQETAITKA